MEIQLINFETKGDEKGSLVALEENKNIPFTIKRVYYIYGTKEGIRRGYHAHKKLSQVLVCVIGSCKVLLDDGKTKQNVTLESPATGLLMKRHIWHEMYDFSSDCVLMVLADEHYNESDYIRNYPDFLKYLSDNDKK